MARRRPRNAKQVSELLCRHRGARQTSLDLTFVRFCHVPVISAALALEALHKQVLPFLLRRLKEDVLADLPPKIIQDYYCDLSDVQKQLYDDFSHSEEASSSMSEVQSGGVSEGKAGGGKGHVFQSLQYLRKLCNHPCLVAKEEEYGAIVEKVRRKGGSAGKEGIKDLENAPKLMALK